MKKQEKKLSPEQLADAARLRALWDKREPKISQGDAAEEWGIGTTQGLVSQYLLGKIPLNLKVLIKFKNGLKCNASDISPTLATALGREASAPQPVPITLAPDTGDVPEELAALFKEAKKLSHDDVHATLMFAKYLLYKGKKEKSNTLREDQNAPKTNRAGRASR